ncbi:ribosome biogenesis GTP-binding protein YihA/YsxC [Ignavigranum ruoffiae]|uniref:Probable GTP-binding protein EngB n=1 Tax=Ignavigranum ruoffiae TaxID=89093 RepID=A0A1H8ZKN0_9LACT|nr:ribosome biogenesis GTP-binding protein YihA/YsxC [Ignavigranum ruoffiae]SEP64288.1 GTP-binding protein [Ignavigranum ruoffiae]
MQVQAAELEISAVSPKQYPTSNLNEIALLGRSNVGKSSFINKLIGRRHLARTSSQPGKTQTLNFYQIDQRFRLVDVPGYGYARVSKKERQQWQAMISQYLQTRSNLALIFLLMDFRHHPSQLDQQMYDWIDQLDIPFALILTKADKVQKNQWNKHLAMFKKDLDLPSTDALFPFSSQTGSGKEDIWQIIEDYLALD